MKRLIGRILIPIVGLALVLGIAATPAQAGWYFNVTIGSEHCSLYGYYLSSIESRVRTSTCDLARARVQCRTSGGSLAYAYGAVVSPGYVSIATAGTSMVTARQGSGAIVEGGTYWSGYVTYA